MIQRLLVPIILCLLSFILFGCDAASKQKGLMLRPELAKVQMFQLIEPRVDWADKNNNYMVQTFDAEWQVVPTGSIELYSQARQVYLFAKGYDITQERRYLQAMVASADVMLDSMYNDTKIFWHSSISRTKAGERAGLKPYSTSFAIFAMAHAYRVSQDKRYLDAALKTWMLDEVSIGSTLARATQQAESNPAINNTWSLNPLMHLFEALLILHDATTSPSVWQDIEPIAQFIEDSLMQEQGLFTSSRRGLRLG